MHLFHIFLWVICCPLVTIDIINKLDNWHNVASFVVVHHYTLDNLLMKMIERVHLMVLSTYSHNCSHVRVFSLEQVHLLLMSPSAFPSPSRYCILCSWMCAVIPWCVVWCVDVRRIYLWIVSYSSCHDHIVVFSRLEETELSMADPCSLICNRRFEFVLIFLFPLYNMIVISADSMLFFS